MWILWLWCFEIFQNLSLWEQSPTCWWCHTPCHSAPDNDQHPCQMDHHWRCWILTILCRDNQCQRWESEETLILLLNHQNQQHDKFHWACAQGQRGGGNYGVDSSAGWTTLPFEMVLQFLVHFSRIFLEQRRSMKHTFLFQSCKQIKLRLVNLGIIFNFSHFESLFLLKWVLSSHNNLLLLGTNIETEMAINIQP